MIASVPQRLSFISAGIPRVLKGSSGSAAAIQTVLAKSFIIVINIVTGIITARSLGPEGRGEQAVMILWPGFLAGILTLGLPSSLIYNLKRYPAEKSELFSAALLLGAALGVVASLVGIVLMPWWLAQYSTEVVRSAQFFMFNAPLVLLLSVCPAALEACGEFAISNQVRCLIPLITLIALCVLALAGAVTPFTAALAYVLNGVPIFFWMLARLWPSFRPRLFGLRSSYKRLIHYGLRSCGIDLLGTLALQVDQVLVVSLLTPASMGIYVVALSLSRMLNVFQWSIITVLFPRAAARPAEEVVAMTGQAARVSTAFTLLVGIIVILFGPLLLRLLYGDEYAGAATILRILVVEAVLSGTTLVLAQTFMALGRPGVITLSQSLGLGLSIALMLVLVPPYGLAGVGIALLSSATIRLFFMLLSYPLFLKVRPPALLTTLEDLRLLQQSILKS